MKVLLSTIGGHATSALLDSYLEPLRGAFIRISAAPTNGSTIDNVRITSQYAPSFITSKVLDSRGNSTTKAGRSMLMTMDLPRPEWPAHEIAVIGGRHEDDLVIAGGYLRVAELSATEWSQNGPDDSLPIPIYYNYRHSVELSLKGLIREAAIIIRRGEYDTRGENRRPDRIDEKLREDSHSIRKLTERLDRYLGLIADLEAPNNKIDPESLAALRWLNDMDQTGETFRYAHIGAGAASRPARPVQTNINFYDEIRKVHDLAWLLQAGYSGALQEFGDLQQEYLEEMRWATGC
ncbi:hypothetical protein ACIPN8_41760 [Streptomyces sp. NPDC086082]|uniref:hypothetical protein n=1 Tax=Streptomyces sp. NPDC086082 TaxID=3365750 RepID=UPI003820660F